MPEDPIRYAVVGLGRAGWNIHINQLRGRPDARIVAVADPVEDRRSEAAAEFKCQTYPTLAKLLKQDDVEVVIIATPSAQHASETKKALRAGRHVVLEKPMATGVAEADGIIKVVKETGRQLFVHQNYRFFPEFRHLREVVESKRIGDVFHVRFWMCGFNRRNDWQTLAKNGGGLLNNHTVHFLDQILQLLPGKVTQVMSDLRQIASAGDVEDHVKALLRTDAGATADLEVSMAENVAGPVPKWVFCGTHGTLTHDGTRSTIRWFDPSQVRPLEVIDGPAQDRKYGNEDKLPWQERVVDAPPGDQNGFYDNVYGVLKRGEPMVITPESVREVMRVIAMIRKGTKFPGKVARTTSGEGIEEEGVARGAGL